LVLVGGVTLYTMVLAAVRVVRFLGPGRFELGYDLAGDIARLGAAVAAILAGLLCVAKIGVEERVRKRWSGDGMVRISFFWGLSAWVVS
jgi:hypothetical protein